MLFCYNGPQIKKVILNYYSFGCHISRHFRYFDYVTVKFVFSSIVTLKYRFCFYWSTNKKVFHNNYFWTPFGKYLQWLNCKTVPNGVCNYVFFFSPKIYIEILLKSDQNLSQNKFKMLLWLPFKMLLWLPC